tara:strand:- start:967 stop:2697 length:1731 start_codon:yes stop_codon:yes gene_type:complete
MATEQESKKISPLHKEFQSLLDEDFKDRKLKENQIISATITEINKNHVIVDIRGKQEGMIPVEEFRENNELAKLKVKDKLDVFLERIESGLGQLVISREKAIKMKAWEQILRDHESQKVVVGEIKSKIRGGYCVLINNFLCFMPSSHASLAPMKNNVEKLFNTPLKFKLLKVDKARGNCICSRKAVLSDDKDIEIKEALKEIKEGQILTATTRALTTWGAFLEYKSVTMLLHISDMSFSRVKHPSELLSVGDSIKVKVTKIDPETNRVSCSCRALQTDPYENIEKKFLIGNVYSGLVKKHTSYGSFIELDSGILALCHQSEMSHLNRTIKPEKVLSISQTANFKVVSLEKEAKRISLSYKDNGEFENPWKKIREKIGKESEIKVDSVTDKAIFGTLTDSKISGMLGWRELSYSEDINELKKYKKGDLIKVCIQDIKDDKIRFSKRSLDEVDPYLWFKENNKKVGDIITTRIYEVLKTGVKVSIDKEKKLITTIKKSDLAKEVADQRLDIFSKGNLLDAKILEIDYQLRKVKLSAKAAMIDQEKSLISKFGENATKSGATLRSLFTAALGKKKKKEK